MTNEVNQKDFAALRGVDPALVSRWKQRGLLVMSADGKLVLVAESNASLDAGLQTGRGGDRTGKSAKPTAITSARPSDFADDRANYSVQAAREKLARAQLAELDLAERAGKLVDAQSAAEATARRVGPAKALMMALSRRLAPTLALESDVGVIERLLSAEMRKACDALAGITPESAAGESA